MSYNTVITWHHSVVSQRFSFTTETICRLSFGWLRKNTRNTSLMSCVWGKDGSLPLGRTLKTDLIKLHITSYDSRIVTHQDIKASSVSDNQSKTWAIPSLKMVGLFLGWIFLNFPLKSAGANICIERLAIWTKTIPSWLWVSQRSGLSSTTTPALPKSSKDISDTDDKRGTAFTCYRSAWMKLFWRSSALYCLSLL